MYVVVEIANEDILSKQSLFIQYDYRFNDSNLTTIQ